MYIEPGTNIRILRNVPLDPTYDHTIYFSSSTNQVNYFIGMQKYNLSNYTYQRVQRGYARVGICAEDLYDCNYLMFQNTSFGSKWFYAFITGVEYVNNECSEISFEIDDMQTWHFDYTLEQCFVEREHSSQDYIGYNIMPENLEVGEHVIQGGYQPLSAYVQNLRVFILVNDDSEAPEGVLMDGVYSGCYCAVFNRTDTSTIKSFLDAYAQKPEAIVAMYMAPYYATITTGTYDVLGDSTTCTSSEITAYEAIEAGDSLNGYVPKNNKLYTYPYTYLQMCAGNGESTRVYRYEYFTDNKPTFELKLPTLAPVQVGLYPIQYKGSGSNELTSECCVLDGFPICSWSSDTFKAWLAQVAAPAMLDTSIGAVGGVLGSLATGNVAGAVSTGVNTAGQVKSIIAQGYQASVLADQTRGNVYSGSLEVASGVKNFYGARMVPKYEYARMIDEYFTRYGYATNRLKTPNRTARPHWNYVKTLGCSITGSVPADSARKICSIYDNGITFWMSGSEIGDYSLDNSIE